MTEEPLAHIARPVPPWSSLELTECGRARSEMAKVIPIDEARSLIAKHGKQRAAFLLCMTCTQRLTPAWDVDPISTLQKHLTRVSWTRNAEDREALVVELRAIAAFIEAHREEFDGFVAGMADTASLADRRRARGRRR